MNDDERLKAAFEKLRAEDARRAPSFEATRRKRRARVSPWAIALPAMSTLAAAAVFLVWCGTQTTSSEPPRRATPPPPPPPVLGMVIPKDDAPLDFLLEIPGLRGTPNFDKGSLR